jgi:succinyl-diaminopimelate desuccinylase
MKTTKQHSEKIIKLASELIQIKSVNLDGAVNVKQNEVIANFVKDWIDKNTNSKAKIVYYEEGFPVVVAQNNGSGRKVLLNGHMDVVPEGDLSKWEHDPYAGVITSDRLIGRGACDMKTGLAMFMYLLSDIGDKSPYQLTFTAVSDEESGGFRCSRHLADKYSPDLVLVSEPTRPEFFGLGEKGVLQIKLVAEGKPAHSSLPSRGKNAITMINRDLLRLAGISNYEVRNRGYVERMVVDTCKIFGEDVRNITVTPAMIKGGTKVNIVPEGCEVVINIRLPLGVTVDDATSMVNSAVKESKVEVMCSAEPNYTYQNDPFVGRLMRGNEQIGPITPLVFTGATDGRYFRYKGIPTIVYGPGNLEVAHCENEYVTVDDVQKVYSRYRGLLLDEL